MPAARLPVPSRVALSGAPTVAAGILARDSGDRLAGIIAGARAFADEVVVGVDEASLDLTLEVALAHADVVYRYRTVPGLHAPRTLAVTRTACDWVLLLRDDELLARALPSVLRPRLADASHTHWFLPAEPAAPSVESPGLEWQPRLVRADPSLLWESPVGGPGALRVMGRGGRADRAELVRDASAPQPDQSASPVGTVERARHLADVVDVEWLPRVPAWHATLSVEHLTPQAAAGAAVLAQIRAHNSGGLLWPATASVQGNWPRLHLACRYTDGSGAPLAAPVQRFPLPADAPPGASVRLDCSVRLPPEPGRHLLHWELVSDGDAWFSDCGAEPLLTMVRTSR